MANPSSRDRERESRAPDPASSYERAKPEKEAGMGRLDNNKAVPTEDPDRQQETVKNRQPAARQINAEDETNQRDTVEPGHLPEPADVDTSMHEEEPMGWDQAPQESKPSEQRRHPRTKGKGGLK